MSANAPILTESSRASATRNVEDYSAGIAAHINGDFAKHNQFNIVDQLWTDSQGHTIPNSKRLRLLVTIGGTDVVVVIPIIPFTPPASGLVPTITTQPISRTVAKGASLGFTVVATGAPTLAYVWQKDGVPIPGASSSTYVLTNAQPTAAGAYSVVVSNAYGLAVSNTAILKVTVPFSGGSESDDEGLKIPLILNLFGF